MEVRMFRPVVAIATGRLTGQIQPWGTRQGRKMSLLGDGCQGRGEEDPAHRMGRPLRPPPARCVRNSAAELGGAVRAGRSHCWRFPSLEVCPQSPHLKSGDNNQGMPSPQSSGEGRGHLTPLPQPRRVYKRLGASGSRWATKS